MNLNVTFISGLFPFLIGCSFIPSFLPLQVSTCHNPIPEKTAALCSGGYISTMLGQKTSTFASKILKLDIWSVIHRPPPCSGVQFSSPPPPHGLFTWSPSQVDRGTCLIGIRYQVPLVSIRYQVLGVRYQISGIRSRISGIRYQVSGIRYQVSGWQKYLSDSYPFATNSPSGASKHQVKSLQRQFPQ